MRERLLVAADRLSLLIANHLRALFLTLLLGVFIYIIAVLKVVRLKVAELFLSLHAELILTAELLKLSGFTRIDCLLDFARGWSFGLFVLFFLFPFRGFSRPLLLFVELLRLLGVCLALLRKLFLLL